MGEFKLPSGRVVETIDTDQILWGDEVHVIAIGLKDPEEYTFAKASVVVPSLTREEVAKLSRKDGRALNNEVNRIWEEREQDDLPKGNGSAPSSTALNLKRSTFKQRAG